MIKSIKIFFYYFLILTITHDVCDAEQYSNCIKLPINNYDTNGNPYITPLGHLEQYSCPTTDNVITDQPEYLLLNKKELLREINLVAGEENKEKTIFIYGGGAIRESLIGGCTGTHYLLDTRGTKPKLIKFGIKNACNQMDKVVWKKDRVIINFNRDSEFVYSYASGKMQLPKDDPDRYDPIFDENSPVIEAYKRDSYPHQKYKLAPPYAREIKLNW